MTVSRDLAVVETLVAVARPIILTRYRADSCIASTRIAIDALAHFGVDAEPFACLAMAYNKRYGERLQAGLAPLDDPDSFSITIGLIDRIEAYERRKAVGHVLALTHDDVIDLSIDQASRPEQGIVLEPFAFPRPPHFTEQRTTLIDEDTGGALVYDPRPDERPWLPSSRWRRAGDKRVTDNVIRAMRDVLG
jgi:hypothetical protein